jgi:hypothetical protein
MPSENRTLKIAAAIKAEEPKASNRKIAKALGVGLRSQ